VVRCRIALHARDSRAAVGGTWARRSEAGARFRGREREVEGKEEGGRRSQGKVRGRRLERKAAERANREGRAEKGEPKGASRKERAENVVMTSFSARFSRLALPGLCPRRPPSGRPSPACIPVVASRARSRHRSRCSMRARHTSARCAGGRQ